MYTFITNYRKLYNSVPLVIFRWNLIGRLLFYAIQIYRTLLLHSSCLRIFIPTLPVCYVSKQCTYFILSYKKNRKQISTVHLYHFSNMHYEICIQKLSMSVYITLLRGYFIRYIYIYDL